MTYYITSYSSKRKSYHGDKDCHQLCQVDEPREATEHHLEELSACKVCLPEERGEKPEKEGGAEWAKFTHNLRAHPEQFK